MLKSIHRRFIVTCPSTSIVMCRILPAVMSIVFVGVIDIDP